MKKSLLFLGLGLVLSGCQTHPLDEQSESEPMPEPVALLEQGIFYDASLGLQFDYPTTWPVPSVEEGVWDGYIFTQDLQPYLPRYEWHLSLGEEGDTLEGPVESNLDSIKETVMVHAYEGTWTVIFDEEMGGNRVLALSRTESCSDLVAYISDGEHTVVYSAACATSYDSDLRASYISKTEIEEVLRQIAGSLRFVGY